MGRHIRVNLLATAMLEDMLVDYISADGPVFYS